ncbi:MAG: glycosyl hydrolase family 18 protein [Dehalococcoidia bacterium]|jgi:spore germination protein YaaH
MNEGDQGGPFAAPPDNRGPFDDLLRPQPSPGPAMPTGRGRAVIVAMLVLGAILLLLVLPPFSLLSRGGGGGSGSTPNIKTTARKGMPQLPNGLEAVSAFYDVSVSGNLQGPATITLQLSDAISDGRNLSAYSQEKSGWQRLGDATLGSGGNVVEAKVNDIPPNIVILRRGASARQLIGYLPAGAQISASAAQALSVVDPVDFSPQADGSLAGSPTTATLPAGLPVRPCIRASGSDGAAAVDAIMASPDLRASHVDAILAMVEAGHYDGVEIDYGAIDSLRKDDFSEFLSNLSDQLHLRKLVLTVTAPLPEQQGSTWNTGAYDWSRLSQVADLIELSPETDPSVYYKTTQQALQYLIDDSKVAPAKLVLRISPFSVEKGGEGISSLTDLDALAIGSVLSADKTDAISPGESVNVKATNIDTADGASGISWDSQAEAVSFVYPGLGGARTVWLENAFSIAFKLELAQSLNLGGVAIEDVSDSAGGADIWPVIGTFLDSGKASLAKPNGSLLVPQWEADGGQLQSKATGAVTWVAPDQPGQYHLTLIISDGVARVGQRLVLTVGS